MTFLGLNLLAEDFHFDISSISLKKGSAKTSHGNCYIPNLTPQQSYIFEDIKKIHFSDTQDMRNKLEKQKIYYKKVLRDNSLKTAGFADDIAKKYFRTKYNLDKAQTAYFHSVFYDILIKDQRPHLIDCL